MPVHRRGACRHSGAPAGRRHHPRAARRQGRQRNDRRRARRAEGSGARLEALGGDGGRSRGRFRRAQPECDDPAVLDGRLRRGSAGRRIPVLCAGLLSAEQQFLQGMGYGFSRTGLVSCLDESQRAGERPRGLRGAWAQDARGGGVTSMADYKPNEMMTIAAARALKNDDVCFVGIGQPSAAANLARLSHAPNVTLIYESGTLGTKPTILPLSIGDGELCETALTTVSVPEMFRYWLQGGRISVGFLGGAQIDRFANLNTTVVGAYDKPKVRLPGG